MKRLIIILIWVFVCLPAALFLISGCESAQPLPEEDNDEWRPKQQTPIHKVYVKV